MDIILYKQCVRILEEEDTLAALCNATAFLYEGIFDINWLGLYFVKGDELVLGPFQGRVACTHLKFKNGGVCVEAVKQAKAVIVKDVHDFVGHILCDTRTNSEIVVPIIVKGNVVAVLDIDSMLFNRFSEKDVPILTKIAAELAKKIEKYYIN